MFGIRTFNKTNFNFPCQPYDIAVLVLLNVNYFFIGNLYYSYMSNNAAFLFIRTRFKRADGTGGGPICPHTSPWAITTTNSCE